MIKLVLLTGFLGSGKTTLIKSILDAFQDKKTGVIINEFGKINVDAVLVKRNGIEMAELSNGSIFCACLKDQFVNSLIEMSDTDIEYLFIEASGLADPANFFQLLENMAPRLKTPFHYQGGICIIDAETYLELREVLPALNHQAAYASVALINKVDLVEESQIREVAAALSELNPFVKIIPASYCQVDIRNIIDGMVALTLKEPVDSTNTVESRLKSVVIRGRESLPFNQLGEFIERIAHASYRIKGFASTDRGPVEVSTSGNHVSLKPWHEAVNETEIVVISAVGIKIISVVADAINLYLKDQVSL